MAYSHQLIEKKWQKFWEENRIFSVKNASTSSSNKKTFYALDMFPFPSGAGLHVGHPEGYTATDIICRKKRMEGYEVLHPMGWDAFGLPAENFAIKTGQHPEISTNANIENFTKQIKSLGFSYDWERELSTTDPDYYKWTQDLFLKFYEKGMLYEDEKLLNWCNSCKVVCANEEVEQGLHERCGNAVTKKSLKQWMFKITDYAERLLQDLEKPNVILLHGWEGTGKSNWFPEITDYLKKNGIDVYHPDFPNTNHPKYAEWKEFFQKEIQPKLQPNSIVVGHSLGCGFLQKYLSEENIKIGEIVFVAPTVGDCGVDEIKDFFTEEFNYEKIKNSADNIFIIAGGKDKYITSDEFKFLAKKLNAHFNFYENLGHFLENTSIEILEFFKKTVQSVLDWPEKIKAMQRNWIGKSEGLLFSSPLIFEYTKKRGTKSSCEGAHSGKINLSGSSRSSQIFSIVLNNIKEVKKKNMRTHISKIQKTFLINNQKIVFDGFALWEHWKRKNNYEKKYRKEFAATVIKSLSSLYYESEFIGYFSSKNSIYRIVFEYIEKDVKRIKTYYRVTDLSSLYQKNKNNLKIQTYSTHFEAFKADTFFVIAPDHPLLPKLIADVDNKNAIEKKCENILEKRAQLGFEEEKESDGIFTGRYIQDPVGNGKLPLWVASFALADYGTGIVKCSCHDERDFAFAKKYNIPLKAVLFPEDKEEAKKVKNLEYCYSDMKNGVLTEPSKFSGKKSGELREEIMQYVEKNNLAERQTNFRLRDWIFTRQRYWGEPIPLVFDENGKCYPLDSSELPLLLPKTDNYLPSSSGESPLAKITDWVQVKGYITKDETVKIITNSHQVPKGVEIQNFTRETSVMPNWAGSSWYYLRYMDSKNSNEAFSKEAENKWGPVDLYVGGAEHAVLHLLYARFWHKMLYDMGIVSTKEPFKKLVNQGLILSYAYQRKSGGLVPTDEIEEKDGKFFEISSKEPVEKITAKMSKSLKNVVNPDEIVEAFGADTLRMYEMFMGPFEQNKAWDTSAVEGMYKFLSRIHRYFTEKEISKTCPSPELIKLTHRTVKKVSKDIDEFKFNTAISQMMVWMNAFQKLDTVPQIAGGKFVRLLAPFAPHLAEELWQKFSPEDETISFKSWPTYDESLLVENNVKYAVQVNGKLRGDFEISKNATKEECIAKAKTIEKVMNNISMLGGEEKVRKEIFVPGKIVGFVVK